MMMHIDTTKATLLAVAEAPTADPSWLIHSFLGLPNNGKPAPSERNDGIIPAPCPKTAAEWIGLFDKTKEELTAMGLRQWNENLFLFPFEWYNHIPIGMPVVGVDGQQHEFYPSNEEVSSAFGVMPFGLYYMSKENMEKASAALGGLVGRMADELRNDNTVISRNVDTTA